MAQALTRTLKLRGSLAVAFSFCDQIRNILSYPLRSFVFLAQSLVMVPTPSSDLYPEPKSPPTERNAAFDNAYKSFYECLPDKDQMLFAPCASSEDLLDGLRRLSCLAKHHNKKSFLLRISDFAASLQPYLNIVDIMVSSNPQYTALVWGALRFIFQVSIPQKLRFELIPAT
jgi:hypothetical protein